MPISVDTAVEAEPKVRASALRRMARIGAPVAVALALTAGVTASANAAVVKINFATSTPDWSFGHSVSSASVRLQFQSDGNLVLVNRANGAALWATNTANQGVTRVSFSASQGTIVLYRGSTPYCLVGGHNAAMGGSAWVQDDGNLVLYTPAHVAVWATNTVNEVKSNQSGCAGY